MRVSRFGSQWKAECQGTLEDWLDGRKGTAQLRGGRCTRARREEARGAIGGRRGEEGKERKRKSKLNFSLGKLRRLRCFLANRVSLFESRIDPWTAMTQGLGIPARSSPVDPGSGLRHISSCPTVRNYSVHRVLEPEGTVPPHQREP